MTPASVSYKQMPIQLKSYVQEVKRATPELVLMLGVANMESSEAGCSEPFLIAEGYTIQ